MAPAAIKVSYQTSTSICIEWEKPYDNGGSPILHYLLEKREGGQRQWHTLTTLPPAATECELENMVMGKDYNIRIRAVNKYGPSESLELARPVRVTGPEQIGENPIQLCHKDRLLIIPGSSHLEWSFYFKTNMGQCIYGDIILLHMILKWGFIAHKILNLGAKLKSRVPKAKGCKNRPTMYIQWNLYIKTTVGTNQMWSLYTGGLYMQVQ